jgi:hypothetical protein
METPQSPVPLEYLPGARTSSQHGVATGAAKHEETALRQLNPRMYPSARAHTRACTRAGKCMHTLRVLIHAHIGVLVHTCTQPQGHTHAPDRCWNSVRDSMECSACPNSWNIISTMGGGSSRSDSELPLPPLPTLASSATAGSCSPAAPGRPPSPSVSNSCTRRPQRMTMWAAPPNLPARGSRSRYSVPRGPSRSCPT